MFNFNNIFVKLKEITISEFKKDEDKFFVIDVRTEDNWKVGHITGAINIPLKELKQEMEKVVKNKNEKIVVYCNRGISSLIGLKELNNLGYQNVFSLKGGYNEYKKA
jgi:rhodanese-related sulfurtransferase